MPSHYRRGIGWKSGKKRWFIITRTSLVFLKNDPSTLPQRGGEVNLTLRGIDLNNSGSVVVREDKKLLIVLFPDGRDGRAFTLKTALELALAQAPSAALVMGHNAIFRNETNDTIDGSFHQWRDKRPVKSLVVGRPILLDLEDIDGGPSFLEKGFLRSLELKSKEFYGSLLMLKKLRAEFKNMNKIIPSKADAKVKELRQSISLLKADGEKLEDVVPLLHTKFT